eukprot:Skav230887  [mRNA]  locus=scaffold2765:106187:115629:- [translate_table: standard]
MGRFTDAEPLTRQAVEGFRRGVVVAAAVAARSHNGDDPVMTGDLTGDQIIGHPERSGPPGSPAPGHWGAAERRGPSTDGPDVPRFTDAGAGLADVLASMGELTKAGAASLPMPGAEEEYQQVYKLLG